MIYANLGDYIHVVSGGYVIVDLEEVVNNSHHCNSASKQRILEYWIEY